MPKYHIKNILRINLLLIIVVNSSVYAQTIITDRPDQTESSSTVEKGSLQIETGILIGFSDYDDFSVRQILAPTTLFRYGITKGIEIRVLNQFESVKNKTTSDKVNGISDLELGMKIQLFKRDNVNTEIALLSHAILPSGTRGLAVDELGTINKLSISHAINDNMDLGYNLGYDNFGYGKGEFTYSLALGFGITDKWGIYLEPYGAIIDFDINEASFDAGIAYLFRNNIQFDFSFGTGINHSMNYISVGCSINIAKEKGELVN